MTVSPTSASDSAAASALATTKDGSMVDKQVFMQLLVAQIKNQNPLNPLDGVQFVNQLATFSQLEQLIGIRDILSQIATAGEQSDASASDAVPGQ